MYKTLFSIAIITSINLGFATSRALAQLTPQQCANDTNTIWNALINGNISESEFVEISNQHHYQHPECGEYVSDYRITPEQFEMQRRRERQHLEYMKQLGDRQVEKMGEIFQLIQ